MAKTKADLIEELSEGKTDAEIKELEGMTKAELEEAAGIAAEGNDDEAPAQRIDETVPGGRYKVGGQIVNAQGEPVK